MSKPIAITSYQAAHCKSSIVVSTTPSEGGWRVYVNLPQRLSGSDRKKILAWMTQYRQSIKHQNPLWDVSFRSGDKFYLVEVKRLSDRDDLNKFAYRKANSLFDEIVDSYAER